MLSLRYYAAAPGEAGLAAKIEQGLRQAIAQNELFLQFQPQKNATTGELVGLEALVRWKHPKLDILYPDQFIPVAEESGLIVPLGDWVLRKICEQIKRWPKTGHRDVRVAANVSIQQLLRNDFAIKLQSLLSEHDIPAQRLEVEITESMLQQGSAVLSAIGSIKLLGVSSTLDDFGVGYSSLSSLKGLPFDRVKIDRSFIRDLPENSQDAALTKVIIAMASALNLEVVAEGAETQAQLDFLTGLGCTTVQGYLIGRPQDAAVVETLLKTTAVPV